MKLLEHIKKGNSEWKFRILKPYLKDKEKMLDFGCGDLGLSLEISRHLKKVTIQGLDVIPLKNNLPANKRLSFLRYDGKKIPFDDNSFDTVIAFYVLHHCTNPSAAIRECARVARKRVLVVESVPYGNFEIPFMKFFDWFFNIIKLDMTPLPYKFYTLSKWKRLFKRVNMVNTVTFHPPGHEDYLPFGKMYILEFKK